ncbi:hypothetical protein [Couchioplanes caeruleus]|uniref:Uncharacterized protein n=1 Tax=Couchioplanes caeruleus TaxID=56438 RepID=A0A3N1GV66_9ACTN|nr:hypothetical protein [Couchioplanes caeruleus]ROP34173.1 hypothetical protein EDD30_7250 [Couchioplanes caeruleus]
MRHRAALAATALAVAVATLAVPGRATAVEPGFEVRITELPPTFGAGAESRTLTVVASSDRRRCQKVRWSLVLQVEGPDLDEVEVERVEDDDDFPVQVERDDDIARITDQQLDPGELCRGRTVTARYRVSIDDDAESGRVVFASQAFTAGGTLLQETSGQSPVVGQERSTTPTESPSPEPEESAAEDEEATPQPDRTGDTIAGVPASSSGGTPSLLGPGLIVGAVLVFLGVGLLLRLRLRNRTARQAAMPARFYS